MQLPLIQESRNNHSTDNSHDFESIKNQFDDKTLSSNNFDQITMLNQQISNHQKTSTSSFETSTSSFDHNLNFDTTLNFQKNLLKCLRENCTNLRYSENGKVHEFCCRTCANMIPR
ncbi:24619_t:CDS:2 [Cetraspora pellucida]|uniref:24619_t:CDS:1 n=1 Tax=Cetraspora pellucida TaxID=1433469 RepID=A0A9N9B6R6_9GLOM|nr:24619_t:CDS:2 [Cetraspora pellucida]